jgi:HAMP domain-containing protein
MKLLLRINLGVGAVFALGALASALVYRSALEQQARREVLGQAALMIDSATAIRSYTANEIDPLLTDQLRGAFLPQSIPFYAATQNFLKLRERHPAYNYKEATLNPTNLRDRASDWEADIIQRFREDPGAEEMTGERSTPMGPSLYLARPIRTEPGCLSCHGRATAAPQTVIARYGGNNGFGWQPNEVIGAQVVSVPLASAEASAAHLFHLFIGWQIAVLAVLLAAVNALLYLIVVRPLTVTARVAERVSLGETSDAQFPTRGADEIATVGRAFERMRVSLEKALKLIES